MTVETATYISDLNASLPAAGDPESEGATHLQLIKGVLQATFPNITAAVTATATALNSIAAAFASTALSLTLGAPSGASTTQGGNLQLAKSSAGTVTTTISNQSEALVITQGAATAALNVSGQLVLNGTAPGILVGSTLLNGVPSGCILLWYGSLATIPAGWALCNGANGTPDLQDRFVVAAGDTYQPGNTGGATTFSAATDSQGVHNHTGAVTYQPAVPMTATADTQGSHSHGGADGAYSLQAGDLPPHTHTVPGISSSGGSGSSALASGPASLITTSATGSGNAHSHAISVDGSHTHNIAVSSVPTHDHAIPSDGAHVHNVTLTGVMPYYYALAYIMKL